MTRRGRAVRMLVRGLGGIALFLAAGCTTPPPPAWVQVELLSGAARRPVVAARGTERLHLILDLTPSMEEAKAREAPETEEARAPGRPPPALAAKAEAARLLVAAARAGQSPSLEVLGIGFGSECPPAAWPTLPSVENPELLGPEVESLVPRAEGSIEEALRAAADHIRRTDPTARWTVVVLSDLGDECGADPCAGLAELAGTGARVELVLLGEGEVPRCEGFFSPPGLEAVQQVLAPPEVATFRVERVGADAEPGGPPRVARGSVGGGPVAVAAGAATLAIDPPAAVRIGPLELEPGILTRVRVLRFPALDPPVAEWTIETGLPPRATGSQPEGEGS